MQRRLTALSLFLLAAVLFLPAFSTAFAQEPYDPNKACIVECEIVQEQTFKGSYRHYRVGHHHTLECELHNKSDEKFKKLTVSFDVHNKDGLYIESGEVKLKNVEPYARVKFRKDLKKSFPFDKDDLVVDFTVERP